MSQAIIREIDDSRRYHCAVMFTDIAGFTELMRKDEQKTILKLESHQRQLELLHKEFDGEVVQYYGDGSLSTFTSPTNAVACAKAIQEHVSRLDLPLRIGIHLGEVVRKGTAIYGDGVNVASRIESVGVPNSILFSEGIWKAIKEDGYEAKSLGGLYFKHVNKAITVYSLVDDALVVPDKNHLDGKLADRRGKKYRTNIMVVIGIALLALGILFQRNRTLSSLLDDEITTVGVMPLRIEGIGNMGVGLRSGLLENMVTNLSSFYGLQVLSSRATENYADTDKQPSEIGQELGVSHILVGTCRPGTEDSLRINLELVDVKDGRNVWAQSVSKTSDDLFANPKEILQGLTSFLKAKENPFIVDDEDQTQSKASLNSLQLVAEARDETKKQSEAGFARANELLTDAVTRDSSFALGHALLSQNYTLQFANGIMDREEAIDKAEQHVGQAFMYDRLLPEAFVSIALINYNFFLGDANEIVELLQQAVQLRPSYAYGHYLLGKVYYDFNDLEQAENYFKLAQKLNPDEFLFGKMLAKCIDAAGHTKTAGALLKRQLKRFGQNPDILETYVRHLAQKGDLGRAKTQLSAMSENIYKTRAEIFCALEARNWDEFESLTQAARSKYPNLDLSEFQVQYLDQSNQPKLAMEILKRSTTSPWLRDINHIVLSSQIRQSEEYQEVIRDAGMRELSTGDL